MWLAKINDLPPSTSTTTDTVKCQPYVFCYPPLGVSSRGGYPLGGPMSKGGWVLTLPIWTYSPPWTYPPPGILTPSPLDIFTLRILTHVWYTHLPPEYTHPFTGQTPVKENTAFAQLLLRTVKNKIKILQIFWELEIPIYVRYI